MIVPNGAKDLIDAKARSVPGVRGAPGDAAFLLTVRSLAIG
jgi:hypothetical protein